MRDGTTPSLWEEVTYAKYDERTQRLKVPGGWIYRSVMFPLTDSTPRTVAMTFVPGRREEFDLMEVFGS